MKQILSKVRSDDSKASPREISRIEKQRQELDDETLNAYERLRQDAIRRNDFAFVKFIDEHYFRSLYGVKEYAFRTKEWLAEEHPSAYKFLGGAKGKVADKIRWVAKTADELLSEKFGVRYQNFKSGAKDFLGEVDKNAPPIVSDFLRGIIEAGLGKGAWSFTKETFKIGKSLKPSFDDSFKLDSLVKKSNVVEKIETVFESGVDINKKIWEGQGVYQGEWWTKYVEFKGNKVYQRDDLIDINRIHPKGGLTSLENMKNGKAPTGPDGRPLNLHHLIQTERGGLVELTETMHQKYSKALHINPPSIESNINRNEFKKLREAYWKQRAKDFEDQ